MSGNAEMRLTSRTAALGSVAVLAASYAASAAALHVRRGARRGARVAFASGGGGSHVMPAVAIACELRSRGVECVLLGEAGGIEAELAAQHGIQLYGISSVALKRPLRSVGNAVNALRFALCLAHSVKALVESAPDVVVGTGGRVSVPACVAAAALGLPVVLYEPNATVGAANEKLHLLARRTLLAYDSAAAGLRFRDRCYVVGPAVRKDILDSTAPPKELAREQRRRRAATRRGLGMGAGATRGSAGGSGGGGGRLLLVLGGYGGSTYLNCAVHNALPQLATVPGLHILWQTGPKQHAAYAQGFASSLPNVHCVPFSSDVGAALAASDLVLSRAGAATVAELRATGAPALLVPSPAVSEAMQAANAQTLAERGLAVVVSQAEVDDIGIAPRLMAVLAAEGGTGRGPAPQQPRQQPTQREPQQRAAPTPGSGGGGGGGFGGGAAAEPPYGVPPAPPALLAAIRAGERREADVEWCRRGMERATALILDYAKR